MKNFALQILCLSILISFVADAADINPPPRLTIELRDGSRVVGESIENNFKFHSALLGDLKLDMKDIRSVECVSTNSAKLTTTSGDNLAVTFLDSELAVKTSFGKVELSADSIRKFTVSVSLASGAYPPGLVALWKGADNGKDSAGNNDAILTDISLVESELGQAFSFNGVSSSIRIPASPSLDIGSDESFTITAWIKPTDVDGFHPLFQWTGDSDLVNASIDFNSTQSGLLMGNIAENGRNHFVVSNQGVLTAGIFQHIALTYDKNSGLGIWYLNGVMVAQRQLGRQLAVNTKGDLWFSWRNTHQGDWSSNRSFAGLMDEFTVYNRALSTEEIKSLVAAENHGEPLAQPAISNGGYESWMR